MGQCLAQLGWSTVSHEMQKILSVASQVLVWWPSSLQVPHKSCFLIHSEAMWFQPWHLRQRIGSFLYFNTETLLLQMTRPPAFALFAASGFEKVRMRCPQVCLGLLWFGGLTQRAQSRLPSRMPLTSSNSVILFGSSVLRWNGMCYHFEQFRLYSHDCNSRFCIWVLKGWA